MKSKLIQFLIILLVAIGVFLAFYLRQVPSPSAVHPSIAVPKPPPTKVPSPPPAKTPAPSPTKVEWSPTFSVAINPKIPLQVGVLGDSWTDDVKAQIFNSPILVLLFDGLKKHDVQAVFYTGNLFPGTSLHSKPIDPRLIEARLLEFAVMYDGIFGNNFPFFPETGNRDRTIPQAAAMLKDLFALKGSEIIGNELMYTVSIGQALFVVVATKDLSIEGDKNNKSFNPNVLNWLDKQLEEGSKHHRYLFVVGHEPAFTGSETFSSENMTQRDAFWKLLVDHHVLAYFADSEAMFDRSYRHGVWQIISGGGGAPLSLSASEKPFYHSLLLTIPVEEKTMPSMQVLDLNGAAVEEFTLSPEPEPIYQMHISRDNFNLSNVKL